MKKKREVRFFQDAEVRLAGDDQKPVITGYAAVFNKPTQIGQRFKEVIRPGAFDRALKEKQDVRALINHDPGKIIGRTKSGTLTLSVDQKGLRYEIDPPDTSHANDLVESLRRGDIDSSSFGFRAVGQKWTETTDNGQTNYLRELTDVDLDDVSPVTYPAYEATSAGVRTMFPEGVPGEIRTNIPEIEDLPAPEERGKKTKTVDGVELEADCFAFVGDPKKTDTWKLPIDFPNDAEKTKAHIRDALSRFDQTEGIPDSEKPKVLAKIKAAAKKHGIDVSDKDDKEKNAEFKERMEYRLRLAEKQ